MAFHSLQTRARVGAVLIALGLLSPALGGTASAAPPVRTGSGAPTDIEPVIDSNFADPDILLVNGVYYAYATNADGQNIQLETSRDLVRWTPQPDALPDLGDWVGECSFRPGGEQDHCIWAPEVTAVDGGYVMYYTARLEPAPGEPSRYQCIGAAFSPTPTGPFVPEDEPFVCPVELGGAIDAATYEENGQLYLLWKSDGNCCSMPATIFIQPLSDDGTTLTGPPVALISNDPASTEQRVVEAPTLIKHNGVYYLFYSANDFFGADYRTMYATSTSITGPYTKQGELLTTELLDGDVVGPGGQDIVVGRNGQLQIVFHGWDESFTYRAMYVSDLAFTAAGVPVVEGTVGLHEAEDGVVRNARVVPDGSASGGAKVGGLDLEDSSVTVRVYAEKSGPAVIGVHFANGSTAGPGGPPVDATSSLTVNGADAGTLTFWHTTWGNWQVVEQEVRLKKGWNDITVTKETYFAEIDAFYLGDDVDRATVAPATATRYEAEAGIVTHANIRPDTGASGGAVVGGLDHDDSSISWQVCTDQAGPATIAIRFTNGSDRGPESPVEAVHSLTVNGRDAGEITYPHTRWGNWQTAEQDVLLKKGCNTVVLTREAMYAEIDYIDVY